MDNKNLRFKELLDAASAKEGSKANALLELKNEIAEARSRSFSYGRIANFLKQVGVDVSSDSVRRFCHDVLKEKVTKRAARKGRVQKQLEQDSPPAYASATQSLRKDDAEVSANSLQANAASTQAKEAKSNQINSSRVGPRPGFRVAGDDL